MTNNLKAERTLTAEDRVSDERLAQLIANAADATDEVWWLDDVADALTELQHLRLQSLSTQQPMGEPVAWIEKEALAALQSDKTARTAVCSGLLRKPFGDKVPLYALHPNQEGGE